MSLEGRWSKRVEKCLDFSELARLIVKDRFRNDFHLGVTLPLTGPYGL